MQVLPWFERSDQHIAQLLAQLMNTVLSQRRSAPAAAGCRRSWVGQQQLTVLLAQHLPVPVREVREVRAINDVILGLDCRAGQEERRGSQEGNRWIGSLSRAIFSPVGRERGPADSAAARPSPELTLRKRDSGRHIATTAAQPYASAEPLHRRPVSSWGMLCGQD